MTHHHHHQYYIEMRFNRLTQPYFFFWERERILNIYLWYYNTKNFGIYSDDRTRKRINKQKKVDQSVLFILKPKQKFSIWRKNITCNKKNDKFYFFVFIGFVFCCCWMMIENKWVKNERENKICLYKPEKKRAK